MTTDTKPPPPHLGPVAQLPCHGCRHPRQRTVSTLLLGHCSGPHPQLVNGLQQPGLLGQQQLQRRLRYHTRANYPGCLVSCGQQAWQAHGNVWLPRV
jgi:hypothetical protein